jgi:hypothetical protein
MNAAPAPDLDHQTVETPAKRPATLRAFRALLITTLVILGIQGWFGDFVTVFVAPANGITPPAFTPGSLLHALQILPTPFFPVWHAFEGLALIVLGIAIAILSFTWTRSRGVRIWSIVGLVAVLAAALGGLLFVESGFAAGGSSMQMGGSFIGAFASYFLALYYTR